MHPEPGCQFNERRARAILHHQFVDLFGPQEGLRRLK